MCAAAAAINIWTGCWMRCFRSVSVGTSLTIRCLTLHTPSTGGPCSILDQEIRSCMPQLSNKYGFILTLSHSGYTTRGSSVQNESYLKMPQLFHSELPLKAFFLQVLLWRPSSANTGIVSTARDSIIYSQAQFFLKLRGSRGNQTLFPHRSPLNHPPLCSRSDVT